MWIKLYIKLFQEHSYQTFSERFCLGWVVWHVFVICVCFGASFLIFLYFSITMWCHPNKLIKPKSVFVVIFQSCMWLSHLLCHKVTKSVYWCGPHRTDIMKSVFLKTITVFIYVMIYLQASFLSPSPLGLQAVTKLFSKVNQMPFCWPDNYTFTPKTSTNTGQIFLSPSHHARPKITPWIFNNI